MARKEALLQIRMTPAQKKAAEDSATSADESLSSFVRGAIEKATAEYKDRKALEVLSLAEIAMARNFNLSPAEYLHSRDHGDEEMRDAMEGRAP